MTVALVVAYFVMAVITAGLYGLVDPEPGPDGKTPSADLIAIFWPFGLLAVAFYAGARFNPASKRQS